MEIDYSLEFINKYLAPPGKKAKELLWSGDCDPPAPVVKRTYDLGVYNVNGGDTTISDTFPYLCRVSPMGVDKGGYFQIYAPFQNENVYTEEWKIKDGYLRVISGFKLTDKPRRLKPISIYYHFYSGAYPISLNALKAVYEWALSQEVNPMFLSEFAQRVLEFRGAAIAYSNNPKDKAIYFCSSGNLRTVRVDSNLKPDVDSSYGVVGYRKINSSYYVALSPDRCHRLILLPIDESKFNLISSNGQVSSFQKEKNKYILTLKSETTKTKATVKVSKTCKLRVTSGSNVNLRKEGEVFKIEASGQELRLEISCKS